MHHTQKKPARRRAHLAGSSGVLFLVLLLLSHPAIARSETASDSHRTLNRLTEIVRDLCTRLHIDDLVESHIDENNDRLVSSEPLPGAIHGYRISFDRRFLETLDEEEITAAIAHELGHVWIFSHHPYLQTEELANEIAMRALPRASMKKIYAKLWARTGISGNLDELLGPEPASDKPKAAVLLP